MVSTRLMLSVNNSSGGETSQSGQSSQNTQPTQGPSQEPGPAKFTRNNAVAGPSTYTSPQLFTSQPPPKELFTQWNTKRTVYFMDLPLEVIEKIFSFLTFQNIAHLRPVSHTMDRICGSILNSTFQRLQAQMLHRFQGIKSKMPRRESARRNHPLACESDIVETLHMRLTLLQMTFGKHIERKHCCFFPGEILDEVYRILHYIKVTTKLSRPYKVTDELFDLSTMAMEYFKEHIEPKLPDIAYFSSDFLDFTTFSSTGSNKNYLCLDSPPQEDVKEECPSQDDVNMDDIIEPLPQSNMVLRKRIRKIKQGMKRYNSQLSLLRQDLRACKRKTAEQQKQISEQQKQLAEQQKQTLEYASRLDENDKKNEEISRKFSTLLQELNKCKTELQYWRSKSPAVPPVCSGCGNIIAPLPQDDLQVLVNQGIIPEGLEFGIEAPLQEIDFIPIAGTSSEDAIDAEVQQQTWNLSDKLPVPISTVPKKRKPTDEVKEPEASEVAAPQISASKGTAGGKRKAGDEQLFSPESKKSKRNQKGRSKRVNV